VAPERLHRFVVGVLIDDAFGCHLDSHMREGSRLTVLESCCDRLGFSFFGLVSDRSPLAPLMVNFRCL